ncbi:MAG: hypothetical protein OXI87_14285 [Albidovulum sp.]|nr:hypothetical protein [Albidovulum sp.]MDE0532608.1 hypothetical protein [Albidovulum sp.]
MKDIRAVGTVAIATLSTFQPVDALVVEIAGKARIADDCLAIPVPVTGLGRTGGYTVSGPLHRTVSIPCR